MACGMWLRTPRFWLQSDRQYTIYFTLDKRYTDLLQKAGCFASTIPRSSDSVTLTRDVNLNFAMSHTTSTSRVLQCPELCRLICEHIGIHDKRTLFRLSLSCRRFMEPALDVLWYKLDNFAPLVLCMARDLYQEVCSPDDGVFTLVSNGFLPIPLIFTLSSVVFSKVNGSERLGTFCSCSNACLHSQSLRLLG
jgi:hypothetical protein